MRRDEAKRLHGSGNRPFDKASFAYDARDLASLKAFLQASRGSAIVLALS